MLGFGQAKKVFLCAKMHKREQKMTKKVFLGRIKRTSLDDPAEMTCYAI